MFCTPDGIGSWQVSCDLFVEQDTYVLEQSFLGFVLVWCFPLHHCLVNILWIIMWLFHSPLLWMKKNHVSTRLNVNHLTENIIWDSSPILKHVRVIFGTLLFFSYSFWKLSILPFISFFSLCIVKFWDFSLQKQSKMRPMPFKKWLSCFSDMPRVLLDVICEFYVLSNTKDKPRLSVTSFLVDSSIPQKYRLL